MVRILRLQLPQIPAAVANVDLRDVEIGGDESVAARVAARGGLAELESRSARLWPDERRCAAADDVIRNDGSTEELQQQIDDYIARYAER